MNCEMCGDEISGGSAFTCTYCGGVYCPRHRLPFNHACRNLEEWKKAGSPRKKTTGYRKSPVPASFLVRRRKELIITGVILLVLLVLLVTIRWNS